MLLKGLLIRLLSNYLIIFCTYSCNIEACHLHTYAHDMYKWLTWWLSWGWPYEVGTHLEQPWPGLIPVLWPWPGMASATVPWMGLWSNSYMNCCVESMVDLYGGVYGSIYGESHVRFFLKFTTVQSHNFLCMRSDPAIHQSASLHCSSGITRHCLLAWNVYKLIPSASHLWPSLATSTWWSLGGMFSAPHCVLQRERHDTPPPPLVFVLEAQLMFLVAGFLPCGVP